MYMYVIDGSNRVRNRVNDRVFIFLPRSKPDRGTGQKTDNPRPVRGEKIELKNPPDFEILPRFSSGPSPRYRYKSFKLCVD